MTMVRSLIVPQIEPRGGNPSNPPLITTLSLPSATTGLPYTFQMSATGGVPPYTWTLPTDTPDSGNWLSISSSGILSGTPQTAEVENLGIQVTDSVGSPTAPTAFSLTVNQGSTQGAPSAIWPGWTDSSHIMLSWWPPSNATGTETYNVYRDGSRIASGITPTLSSQTKNYQLWYLDTGLTANTTHVYNVTAVSGTTESSFSVPLTSSTLNALNTPTTPPAPPTDPSASVPTDPGTWMAPFALPVGGTTWTATNTSDTNTIGVAGTGTLNATGCSLQYALNNASAGDIIVCTAGATYTNTAGTSAFTIPAGRYNGGTGATPKFLYIISSQDPVLTPGGTLPAFSFTTTPGGGNWVSPSNVASMATIQFTQSNVYGWEVPPGLGYVRFVGINTTPLQNANQTNFVNGCMHWQQSVYGSPVALCNHIYFDRCMFGGDSTNPNFTYLNFGMLPFANHLFVHQCYFQGCVSTSGGDNYCMLILGGGQQLFQNSFFEGGSEGIIWGGSWVDQDKVPHDLVYRYCTNQKNPAWFNLNNPLGNKIKNHIEFKIGVRFEAYGNIHLNCGQVVEPTGSQEGRSYVMGARDSSNYPITAITAKVDNGSGSAGNTLTVTAFANPAKAIIGPGWVLQGPSPAKTALATITQQLTGTPGGIGTYTVNGTAQLQALGSYSINAPMALVLSNPWTICTDINIHDNQMYGIGAGFYVFTDDDSAAVYTARVRFVNNFCQINPVGAVQAQFNGFIDDGTTNHLPGKVLTVQNPLLSHLTSVGFGGNINGAGVPNGIFLGTQITSIPNSFGAGTWNISGAGGANQLIPATGGGTTEVMTSITPTPPNSNWIAGPVSDVIVDHNTFILNAANNNFQFGGGLSCSLYEAGNAFQTVVPAGATPNAWPIYSDRWTITNNIFDAVMLLYGNGFTTVSPAPVATTFTNVTFTNNLTTKDVRTGYPGTNFLGVPYANIGFQNFGSAATPPSPVSNWNVTTTANATNSTTRGPLGAHTNELAISTAALTNAVVGANYSQTLVATGGSGSYAWNIESASPNRHLWLFCSQAGILSGTPQCDTAGQGLLDNITVRVTDTASGISVTGSYPLTITTSGALTVISPTTLPNAAINGGYAYQLIAQGGSPPYIYWQIISQTGSNTKFLSNNGWLYMVPTVAGTDTVTVECIDSVNNISGAVTFSVTTNSTMQIANVDYLNNCIKVPSARAGHKYSHTLHPANGGTGSGQTYAIVSGTLPAGLSMTSAGVISGTPTQAGNAACSLQVTDSGSNTQTIPLYMNVAAQSKGTKPAANTGTGFFVDTTGQLCDSSGFRFVPRGLNRNHYDQTFSGYATSGCNAVRYTIFHTIFRGSTPSGAQSMATYAGDAVAQHTNNKQFVIFTPFFLPGSTTNLTGTGTPTDGGTVAAWWADNVAAYNASGLQNKSAINLQNEWGPTGASFQNCYAAVNKITITSVNTSTGVITLNSSAATNPFANAASIGYAYISGGGINAAVTISTTTGGVSGAWTVTATTLSQIAGFTGSATLSGGMIGIVRAAGYTDPIVIDAMNTGQYVDAITTYSQSIAATDPLKNTIFSYHSYGTTVNYTGRISNVSGTTITLNSNAAGNPMQPTSTFSNVNDVFVAGVTGTMGTSINGDQATTSNGHAGASGAWTVPLVTAPTGVYGGGGVVVPGVLGTGGAGKNYHHVDRLVASFTNLQSSGLGFIMGEFGPGGNGGPSPTTMQYMEIVQSCEAANIPYIYWAMDDATATGTSPGNPAGFTFGITGSVENGTYTVPTQLKANGIDVVLNPRYGLHCLAAPASSF